MIFSQNSQLPFPLPNAEERVGTGSTSEVYKVIVEPGHFQYKENNNRNYEVSIPSLLKQEVGSLPRDAPSIRLP